MTTVGSGSHGREHRCTEERPHMAVGVQVVVLDKVIVMLGSAGRTGLAQEAGRALSRTIACAKSLWPGVVSIRWMRGQQGCTKGVGIMTGMMPERKRGGFVVRRALRRDGATGWNADPLPASTPEWRGFPGLLLGTELCSPNSHAETLPLSGMFGGGAFVG